MLHECMKTRMVLTRLLQKPAKNSGNVKNVTRCSQITGRYLIIKSNLIHIRIAGSFLKYRDCYFATSIFIGCLRFPLGG